MVQRKRIVSDFIQNPQYDIRKETRIKYEASNQTRIKKDLWLEQFFTEGWKLFSCAFKVQNTSELKYNFIELEVLAFVWAVTYYQN